MGGNYDVVAHFYDRLSRFVFGDAIYKSQLFLLNSIPAEANVLIVGGGSGWILEEITRLHSSGLHITYVEKSEKMLSLSKKRNTGSSQVIFINQTIQDAKLDQVYDVVITPFLFDNFSDITLKKAFEKIDRHLNKGGRWLFADFQLQAYRIDQQVLLKTMYLFFNFFCSLETTKLPDTEAIFHNYSYRTCSEKRFFNGFIISIVYLK